MTKLGERPPSAIEDQRLANAIILYFFLSALNISIKLTFSLSERVWSTLSQGLFLILAVYFVFLARTFLQRTLFLPLLSLEIIFCSLYVASYFQGNADASILLSNAFITLGVCIPLAICIHGMDNKAIFLNSMHKLSYLFTIMLSIALMKGVGLSASDATYSMSASYALLLPLLIQINSLFNRWSFFDLAAVLVGISSILLFGSRGALVCVIIFILVKLLSGEIKFINRIAAATTLLLLALMVNYLGPPAAQFILETLESKDAGSRNVILLSKQSKSVFFESSSRKDLRQYYWALAQEKPFTGWGISGGWKDKGLYPHNMILEHLLAFGLFFGGLLASFSVLALLYAFTRRGSATAELAVIFASCSLSLFLSHVAIVAPYWFILMPILYTSLQTSKEQHRSRLMPTQ